MPKPPPSIFSPKPKKKDGPRFKFSTQIKENQDKMAYLTGQRGKSYHAFGLKWDIRVYRGEMKAFTQYKDRIGVITGDPRGTQLHARLYHAPSSRVIKEDNFEDFDSASRAVRTFIRLNHHAAYKPSKGAKDAWKATRNFLSDIGD